MHADVDRLLAISYIAQISYLNPCDYMYYVLPTTKVKQARCRLANQETARLGTLTIATWKWGFSMGAFSTSAECFPRRHLHSLHGFRIRQSVNRIVLPHLPSSEWVYCAKTPSWGHKLSVLSLFRVLIATWPSTWRSGELLPRSIDKQLTNKSPLG